MTKDELIQQVAEDTGEEASELEHIVDVLIEKATASLASGDAVLDLAPLGRFSTRQEGAHAGTNPRTHEPIHIGPSVRVLFHPAKQLHDAVQALAPAEEEGQEEGEGPSA